MRLYSVILIVLTIILPRTDANTGPNKITDEQGELTAVFCTGPEYYQIDLVPTKKLPGLSRAKGFADLVYNPSPFGVSLNASGNLVYSLQVKFENLRSFPEKSFVVWLTTPDLANVIKLGSLDANGSIQGKVDWNKFLVVVSLEDAADSELERWKGPIAYRGMSRSGLMHTMAGHGPFEQEPCMVYGYQ